jgi:alkanesulfonate monooxygenase SsuD/methylene tetrahydromethanopterin reductase-like flavin-dependent oxidoreductase (luciferase family)
VRVGVGLPATVPGTPGGVVLDWARRADAGPFSSLGVLDRMVYDNHESLTVLAAAAAVTERITLATTIVIAPLRSAPLLAKQADTVHALSGGRLVLGVGLGAREDDYSLTGAEYRTRGRRLTEHLLTMRNQWEDHTVGPRTGRRPTLLVGGSGGLAASRMARYADGAVHNGGPPRAFARAAAEARAAWRDMGRPGAPALWGMAYFQLGGVVDVGASYLRDYYAFTGPFADRIAAGLLTDASTIREFTHGYADAGCDELILFPAVAEIDQLDRLAEIVAGS